MADVFGNERLKWVEGEGGLVGRDAVCLDVLALVQHLN